MGSSTRHCPHFSSHSSISSRSSFQQKLLIECIGIQRTKRMKSKCLHSLSTVHNAVAVICMIPLALGDCYSAKLQETQTQTQTTSTLPDSPSASKDATKIPAEQLDSLVAPIALWPDPLLAQTLAASTYPLEI